MIDYLLNFAVMAGGVWLGAWLGLRVDPAWIDQPSRAFYRLLHHRGCPFPLKPLRRERLRSYQSQDKALGVSFQVDVFDIRARCTRCGRTHRVEMKIFHQINPRS